MSSNMPILWQNCLLQFRSETAKKAWVFFAENRGTGRLYDADKFASEVERILAFLSVALPIAAREQPAADSECLDDLTRFFLKRHANMHFGGNVSPPYCNPKEVLA